VDGDDALDLGADLMDESEVALFFFIGSDGIGEVESFGEALCSAQYTRYIRE
jgi:hypothetical protein